MIFNARLAKKGRSWLQGEQLLKKACSFSKNPYHAHFLRVVSSVGRAADF